MCTNKKLIDELVVSLHEAMRAALSVYLTDAEDMDYARNLHERMSDEYTKLLEELYRRKL